jgi:hypothetical protein
VILQRFAFLLPLLFLSSCGYKLAEEERPPERETVSVPYVVGDAAGQFTNELIRELGTAGYQVENKEGNLILKVSIIQDGSERIGFRYDRDDSDGKRQNRLINVESRKVVTAQVTLLDGISDEILLGPINVICDADYDYVDFDSPRDLAFTDLQGQRLQTINFSLGQLDTIEGAQDDALIVVYRRLAQRIVDGLVNHKW